MSAFHRSVVPAIEVARLRARIVGLKAAVDTSIAQRDEDAAAEAHAALIDAEDALRLELGERRPTNAEKAAFYRSWDWSTLRMRVIKAQGRKCACCGTTGRRIQVDHIQPLSKRWDLRLTQANLQVLCAACNRGKGAWDQTDWRK